MGKEINSRRAREAKGERGKTGQGRFGCAAKEGGRTGSR